MLLTEYFDESLVLLKRLLCWEFDDIVYMAKGVRKDDHRFNISDDLKEKIRRWNAGDALIYDHFNGTFWKKVSKYGPGFESDLAEFRQLKQKATDRCVSKDRYDMKDNRFYKLVSRQNKTDEYCTNLLRYDNDYTSMLKRKYKQMGAKATTSRKQEVKVVNAF